MTAESPDTARAGSSDASLSSGQAVQGTSSTGPSKPLGMKCRKAVITITDVDRSTDDVNVKLVFDGKGADDNSAAHRTAVEMLASIAQHLDRDAT